MRHAHIHVTGIVQGVGMRPFVYREAMAHGICGWVLNAGDGVHIEAHALSESLDEFVDALSEHAPAASRMEHVEVVDLAPGNWDAANERDFRIVASQDQTAHDAHLARHRHVRRLPARAIRPRRPTLSLPLYQLHQLWTALYHHPLAAL